MARKTKQTERDGGLNNWEKGALPLSALGANRSRSTAFNLQVDSMEPPKVQTTSVIKGLNQMI